MSVDSNAHDNPQKRGVRDKISDVINKEFGDRKLNMIELLGSGVGLELYLRRLPNLQTISVVERNFASYRKFMSSNKLRSLEAKYGLNKIHAIRANIDKLFRTQGLSYNVVNLDFCGIFKKTVVHNTMSNVIPVETMFKHKCIDHNGILFVTYKIGGWYPAGWEQSDVISNPLEIFYELSDIALANGYIIDEIHREVYKSQEDSKPGLASTMLSMGLKVQKIAKIK